MAIVWTVVRWALLAIAGVLGVLAVLVAAVGAALQSEDGRRWAEQAVSGLLSTPGETEVRLEGLGAGLPRRLAIERLEVADASGPWLRARGFVAVWSPAALLSREAHVREITLDRLHVLRPPIAPGPPPEAEATEFTLPDLPVRVRLDRLLLADVHLEEPVIGQEARLRVEGRLAAQAAGGEIRTDLQVATLGRPEAAGASGAPGAIRLHAGYDPRRGWLTLDAGVDQPAGSLLPALIGLPDGRAVFSQLRGDGPIDEWRGTIVAEAGGTAKLDADLTLAGSRPYGLGVRGLVEIAPELLPELRPALRRGLRVDVLVRQPDDERLVLERLEIAGDGVAATASGTVGMPDLELDVAAEATLSPAALAPSVLGEARFGAAMLRARVRGRASSPELAAEGSVQEPRQGDTGALRLAWSARVAPASDVPETGWRAALLAEADGVRAPPALAALLGDRATAAADAALDAAGTGLTLSRLEVAAAQVRLLASGSHDLESGRLDARAELTLPDLAPIAAASGSNLRGRGAVDVVVGGTLHPPALDGSLIATLDGFASGVAAADALSGPSPRLTAAFGWRGTEAEVRQARLVARHLDADASARLDEDLGRLQSQATVRVPSLAPLSQPLATPLAGAVELQARASGDPADPAVTAEVRLSEVVAGGTRVPRGRIDLAAERVGTAPEGSVTVDLATDAEPVTGRTRFLSAPEQRLRLSDLAVRGLGLAVDGALDADLAAMLVSGRLQGRTIPGTEPAGSLPTLAGTATLDLDLVPEAGGQRVRVILSGRPLVVRERGGDLLSIGSMRADADVADAFGTPRLRAEVVAEDVAAAGVALARLRAEADGTPADARVRLSAATAGPSADTLDLDAVLRARGEATDVTLQRLQAETAGYAIRALAPARLSSAAGRMELSSLDLAVGDGRLTASGRLAPGETQAELTGTALPVGLARRFAPAAPEQGRLDLDLRLATSGGAVVGEARAAIEDVRFGPSRLGRGAGATTLSADLRGRLGGGIATLDGEVVAAPGGRLRLDGRIPASLPPGRPEPALDRNGPVSGRLDVEAELRDLADVLALADQRVEGRISGGIDVSGTLAQPRAGGAVELTRGLYENFVTGTLLQDLALRVAGTQAGGFTLALSGNDGGSGRISGEGRIDLEGEDAPRVEVVVEADDATLVRRDDVTATIDSRLQWTSAGREARLEGRIVPEPVEVRLLDRLPPSVVELPVIEIGRPGLVGDAEQEAAGAAIVAGLDVTVEMPRRVFVRGRGLESEWSGLLSIAGTTAAPKVGGEVSLVRGTFTFAGRRFELQRGIVRFDGSETIDPAIDALAEYRASEITAMIAVTGLVSDPEIEISSQPPLPESEVLARVLFGKSTARLGPVEAVQLAAALETLARGESTTDDAFGFARTLLGLDTLAVEPGAGEDEGSSVAVGRYIGDSIYVGARQGLRDDSRSGVVEVEILPGISVETEVGQQSTGTQGSLGLKWKLDY